MIKPGSKYFFLARWKIIFLIGGLQLSGNPILLVARDSDIYFKSLVPEQSLSQLTISSIFQDSKGFLWFGTLDGLNRYDGYNIKVFQSSDKNPGSISSNYINAITEDSLGYLWIGTDNGLNRFCSESNEFTRFTKGKETAYNISHDKASFVYRDRSGHIWIGTEQGIDCVNLETLVFTKRTFNHFLYNNRIISIHDDSYGNLWIGTLRGLVKYNIKSDKHVIYKKELGNANSLSNSHIRSIFEDSRKNLWIGTFNGLNLYDPKSNSFRRFGKTIYPDLALTNDAVRCITEDGDRNLLIGTNKGLNIFNLDTKSIKKYVPDKIIPGSLNHFFVYSLFVDNAETVWIGTINNGLNYFNQKYNQFRYFNPATDFVYGSINKIILKNNNLWIGTGGGGLLQYDQHYSLKNQYLFDKAPHHPNSTNFIHSIVETGNSLLLGSESDQLLLFDLDTREIEETLNGFNNYINNIYETHSGELFFCVYDTLGLRKLNLKQKNLEIVTYLNSANRKMLFPFPTCIVEESPGVFWIGTRFVGLYYYNTNDQTVKRYVAGNDSLSLHSNYISALYIDNLNNLWIGTSESGLFLFSKETESFHSYDIGHGLPDMDIRGILQDEAGYLWIATVFGVSRFDPTKNEFINFNNDNGFPLQEISRYSITLLENGHIAVGGNNGFTIFNPLEIKFDSSIPPVLITDFRLLNSSYSDNSIQVGLLMNDKKGVELKYNQSNFIIEFTALEYVFPKNMQYAYKLEGFDTEWNYVHRQRTATYTNLNAGTYLFRVKASNNDGIWNESQRSLTITVYPPFWKTWWAYTLYVCVILGLLLLFFHYFRLKNKIKLKQLEQENTEKTNQLRLRMFTNFSQELRTPLTLILGPLEDMMNDKALPNELENALKMIRKNTNRLKLLVEQLIDFRKQESGGIKLKAAEGRFNKFITEVMMAFNVLAIKQKIDYKIEISNETIYLWFDRQQMEKVFFNLLSNAFNNTPTDGSITISVEKYDISKLKELPSETRNILVNTGTNEFVETRIKNSGKGIPEEEYDKIFDPFYQMAENTSETWAGTGIGLSLVKGITELHHGIVSVDSVPGEFTTFSIILPVGKGHLTPDEIQRDYIPSENITNYHLFDEGYEEEISTPAVPNKNKYTILIIDDNNDIRDYLKSQLVKEYNIIEASDGNEGFTKALKKMPDLIISDIMIPEIDGLQLCQRLKTDIHTCHIPIILLTARTSFLKIKEVYEVGADDYIIKPFSANLLRLKIKSIFINRERLKQSMGEKLPYELISAETASMDEQFLDKVYQAVEMNISNPDFLIDDLGKEIGMSRSTLYRKIKALTNYSPNEFIKNYRLRVAAKYLRETDLPISEIAYKTGFNNPAYFTNCFRKFYKTSPTNYIQNFERSNGRQKNES